MSKMIKYKALKKYLLLCILCASGMLFTAQGASPRFNFKTFETVNEKDTFALAVDADSVLTGEGVYAYRFYITYDASRFTFLGVDSLGTVLQSWGMPYVNSSNSGVVILAGAGAAELTGTGTMFYLGFRSLNQYGNYFRFTAGQSYLNEGMPNAAYGEQWIDPVNRSYPDIYYDSGNLYIGEEAQMYVSGGVAPFTYETENTSVAVITNDTKIKAVGPGYTRVKVSDGNGEVSYTSGSYDVRAIRLSMTRLTVWPTDTFSLPILIEVAPGTEVYSGSFDVRYYGSEYNMLTQSAIKADFEMSIQSKVIGNRIRISFASSTPITGNGVLCYFQLAANQSGTRSLYFENSRFNESLLSFNSNNYMIINSLPTLSISPNSGNMMWGETQKITVGNGTAPYRYSVSDTNVARIDLLGNLFAKAGGNITVTALDDHGATKTSGTFRVNDNNFAIMNTDGELDKDVRIPISTSLLPTGKKVFSFDGVINYQDNFLTFQRIDPVNAGMSVTAVENGNSVHIVGAAGSGIASGVVAYLVFRIKPALALDATANVNFTSMSSNENALFSTTTNGKVKRVAQVSYRPIANAGLNLSKQEGDVVQLDGTGSFDDDGDPLTYLWSNTHGIVLNDVTSSTPTFTAPEVNVNTNFIFKLVVNDGVADSDTSEVTVTVLQVNKKPVANAGPDASYLEGSSVSLDGSGSFDLDLDVFSYQWTSLDGIILFNSQSVRPSFIAPQVNKDSVVRFKLVVSDVLQSDPDTVSITVQNINKKPVAFAGGDQTVEEADLVTLDGSVSADADGDPITFLWTAPAEVVLSSLTDTMPTFTAPSVHHDSTLVFTLVVNDGKDDSAPDEVKVNVINVDTLSTETKIDSVMLAHLDSFAIDTLSFTVTLFMPYGYDNTSLNPDFKLSELANISPLGGTARNFSTPQSYTVTAEDGVTQQAWTVKVHIPTATHQRELLAGWNWISLNVIPADLSIASLFGALNHTELDYLKSNMYSSVYYTGSGWFGDLSFMPQLQMVQYSKAVGETWSVTGDEINPTLMAIPLAVGWNNIAYLLKDSTHINDAFKLSTIPTGDVTLKSKSASAVYFSGAGWVGDLDSLEVLHGYKIKVAKAGNLKYDTSGVVMKSLSQSMYSRKTLYDNYHLQPSAFEFSSTLIAEVADGNGENKLMDGDLLIAMKGEEVRGVAEARFVSDLHRRIFVLTYFSNSKDEEISFVVKSNTEKREYVTDLLLNFEPDLVNGEAYAPLVISLAKFNSTENITGATVVTVYPNPVQDLMVISSFHQLRQVHVVNAAGVRVYSQNVSGNRWEINTQNLPSGMYTVLVETSEGVINRKVIKTLK